jgi:hypothetical protein
MTLLTPDGYLWKFLLKQMYLIAKTARIFPRNVVKMAPQQGGAGKTESG